MKKLFVFCCVAVLAAACPAVITTQTFNDGVFPATWTPDMGDGSEGSTWSFVTGTLGGYIQTELHSSDNDDGVAKIYFPIGDLYPSGTTYSTVTDSWMQFDVMSLSGSKVTTSVGVFNSAGDVDNDPVALYNTTSVGLLGDGTVTKLYPRMGSGNYNGGGPACRVKMHIYKSGTNSYTNFDFYSIDSQGVVSSTPFYSNPGTFLNSTATLATTLNCFGIKNARSTTYTGSSVFLFDNMYFSTDSAFAGTMPAPFVIPEPATIAILGLGMIAALRTRKH